MLDFRLKVFHTVATRLNFTKAAEELFISQPAVSKHIHEIEVHYKNKFFERNGTRIKLTAAGKLLLRYVEEILAIHRKIEMELAALTQEVSGTLHIGASTTVAQYFLPVYLASFKQKFPHLKISLSVNNTEHIEHLLIENKLNFAIVEGHSKRKDLIYLPIVKDEIVLCTRTGNPIAKKVMISVEDLKHLPLVIREGGSGSHEVILAALKQAGISASTLNIDMEFESTESIKYYLLNSDTYAFLSINAIFDEVKSGTLKVVDIQDFDIERYFYFITQQGDTHALNEIFIKHLTLNNLKL